MNFFCFFPLIEILILLPSKVYLNLFIVSVFAQLIESAGLVLAISVP